MVPEGKSDERDRTRDGSDDDRELMLAVQRGGRTGEAAFEELVRRHHHGLIGFFYRKSWDRDDAHDRAQEVFLKIWGARMNYEPRASFRAFLFQVARNHWIDVVRSRRARPRLVTGDGGSEADEVSILELEPADTVAPGRDAELREIARHIREAVAKLPRGQREVWELAEQEGLRYAEIGEVLDIPVGTVKSRHYHAVRKLKSELASRGLGAFGFDTESSKTESGEVEGKSPRGETTGPAPGNATTAKRVSARDRPKKGNRTGGGNH